MTRVLAFLSLALAAQAGDLMTYWRPDGGDFRQKRLTAIPGYVLSINGAGEPELMAGGTGAGDVTGPAGPVISGRLAAFDGTTGKILMDSTWLPTTLIARANHTGTQAAATITGLAASATTDTTVATNISTGTLADGRLSANIPLINAANTFTQRQKSANNAIFPGFTSSYTGGMASAFWNGGSASVITFDSAGQLLFQIGSNANIQAGNGTGSYVGMIQNTGRWGVSYSDAGATLDHALNVNGATQTNSIYLKTTHAGLFSTRLNPATPSSDTTITVPSRTGTMALTDSTSTQAMLNGIGITQGTILYRGAGTWDALTPGTAGQYLQTGGAAANPSWATPAGSGDVVGPASAISTRFASFNGTTGKLIQDSGWSTTTVRDRANHTGTQDASTIGAGVLATARLGTGTANSTTYLRGDGSWQTPSGTGDVVGPASSVGGQLAAFDGTTGKLLTDSTWTPTALISRANHTGTQAAGTITGLAASATTDTTNAANITTGTLPDARFPATLPAASGVNLTALNASNLASGTVGTARLGTGTASSTTYLRGDGTWATPAGGAGTKTIARFRPLDNEPPTSAFATLDTRNSRPVLDFDTTTQETAIFTTIVPEGTVLTDGLMVIVWASATSATSGTIGWDVAFERLVDGGLDTDSDSFGTAQTITAATVSGTSGILDTTSVTFTQAQLPASLAAGDLIRVRLRRDVATDTATGDAEVHAVELRVPAA